MRGAHRAPPRNPPQIAPRAASLAIRKPRPYRGLRVSGPGKVPLSIRWLRVRVPSASLRTSALAADDTGCPGAHKSRRLRELRRPCEAAAVRFAALASLTGDDAEWPGLSPARCCGRCDSWWPSGAIRSADAGPVPAPLTPLGDVGPWAGRAANPARWGTSRPCVPVTATAASLAASARFCLTDHPEPRA